MLLPSVAYESGGRPPGLKKIRANSVFRASTSCSKVLKDKKYFIAAKNSGKTLFQGSKF